LGDAVSAALPADRWTAFHSARADCSRHTRLLHASSSTKMGTAPASTTFVSARGKKHDIVFQKVYKQEIILLTIFRE
jgi:hypothetical protein